MNKLNEISIIHFLVTASKNYIKNNIHPQARSLGLQKQSLPMQANYMDFGKMELTIGFLFDF